MSDPFRTDGDLMDAMDTATREDAAAGERDPGDRRRRRRRARVPALHADHRRLSHRTSVNL
ncbi:hypothetical protein [Micromonospora sp. CNB394]|uniref:hypothetical protein n=1 Tax=Micromonospora sp. CNB394 TaxID=1169151 RepID=UPI0012DECE8A|nr:hypothetical protein [Micromonospora sp. CNB394]